MPTDISDVAIIGAGIAGLIAARILRDDGFKVRVFEARDRVGGAWLYSDDPPKADNVPSSDVSRSRVDKNAEYTEATPIYKHLHTNLAHHIMSYRNEPYPQHTDAYPHHPRVLDYIVRFVELHDLTPLISFGTAVVNVERVGSKWRVSTQNGADRNVANFDAVVVGNGHYNAPYIPDLPGIKEWVEAGKGKVMHSRQYRTAEALPSTGNVLLIGNRASGADISRDIAISFRDAAQAGCTPRKVYHAMRLKGRLFPDIPGNQPTWTNYVEKKTPLVGIDVQNDELQFEATENGDESADPRNDAPLKSQTDLILFCTGYLYSFPFLRHLYQEPKTKKVKSTTLITSGHCVHNLFSHVFYIPDPTLAFLGLPLSIVPQILSETQVEAISSVWSGRSRLPTQSEMRSLEEQRGRGNESAWIGEIGRRKMVFNGGNVEAEFEYVENEIGSLVDWEYVRSREARLRGVSSDKLEPVYSEKRKDLRRNAARDKMIQMMRER